MSKRILVVDDSATMRDLLIRYLQGGDNLVAGADSGAQALDLLKTERYDVIVTDLAMPEMDGFGLIRAISELDWDPSVILLTGHDARTLQSAKELALAYSINLLGTLTKPVNKDMLLHMLSDVADTRTQGRTGTETVLAENEFMRGLMTDGLSPVFQPKISLKTGALAGAEVFARWRAPNGGYLGAGAVIKAAQEKGHMDVLTYRMLELAMQQQGRWRKQGLELALSINVASDNLRKADFADVVSGLAEQFEVEPKMVRLEVTEADLDVDVRVPLEVLSRLSLRGFGLALDDFGTGFASLMRLKTIPFDEIVVDRMFISRAAEDDTSRIILESAIELSHKLNLRCTCEGVETEEQLTIIRALGADYAQGYLLGKPMTAEEFLIWFEDYRDGVLMIPGLGT
ncbi:EAL domain-containing response regulator [Kordiimonas aestuarii]|uniref:EAL domain-containing response regulator n=1 Tax=Kordiimonas aestuarii TaxID=1005925 RepID=UPI0021D28482|nr:EAL domain-containing protein [Kordiimonas aestuarii]